MGYRSEVAIQLSDDAARLLYAVAEHRGELKELLEEAETTIDLQSDDIGGKLYWDHVKWYDGFPCVDAVETMMMTIPDEDFHFIKIGEDTEDITQHGCLYGDMYVQRCIVW